MFAAGHRRPLHLGVMPHEAHEVLFLLSAPTTRSGRPSSDATFQPPTGRVTYFVWSERGLREPHSKISNSRRQCGANHRSHSLEPSGHALAQEQGEANAAWLVCSFVSPS